MCLKQKFGKTTKKTQFKSSKESKTKTEQKFEEKSEDFWLDTETKTSTREPLEDFIKNYKPIIEFNEPVMKYFNKSYGDLIKSFPLRIVQTQAGIFESFPFSIIWLLWKWRVNTIL